MAVLGDVFGPYAVLLTVIAAPAAYVILIGQDVIGRRGKVVIVMVALLLAGLVELSHLAGVNLLRSPQPATTSPAPSGGVSPGPRARSLTAADMTARLERGESLDGAVLDGIRLEGAQLDGMPAPGASMRNAVFTGAQLAGARLPGVQAGGIDLRNANLRAADLRGADLRDAKLQGACLDGADLTGALLDRADAAGASTHAAQVTEVARTRAKTWPATAPGAAPSCH